MRKSETIVKDIKGKNFANLESDEYKELSLELHLALTYERNTKLIKPTKDK